MKRIYGMMFVLLFALCVSFAGTPDTVKASDALTLEDVPDSTRSALQAFLDEERLNDSHQRISAYVCSAQIGYKSHLWFNVLVFPEPTYITFDGDNLSFGFTAEDYANRGLDNSAVYRFYTIDTNLTDDRADWLVYKQAEYTISPGMTYVLGQRFLLGGTYETDVLCANFPFRNEEGTVFFYPAPLGGSVLQKARHQLQAVLVNHQGIPAGNLAEIVKVVMIIGIGTILFFLLLVIFIKKSLRSAGKSLAGSRRRFRRRRSP